MRNSIDSLNEQLNQLDFSEVIKEHKLPNFGLKNQQSSIVPSILDNIGENNKFNSRQIVNSKHKKQKNDQNNKNNKGDYSYVSENQTFQIAESQKQNKLVSSEIQNPQRQSLQHDPKASQNKIQIGDYSFTFKNSNALVEGFDKHSQINDDQNSNNSPAHQNQNVRFSMAYEILDDSNIPRSALIPSPKMGNYNYQDRNFNNEEIQDFQYSSKPYKSQKGQRKNFSIKKYHILKQQAEREKKQTQKTLSLRDEYQSIMNRLENVNAKDLKSKIKTLIDDSYQQKNLIEQQKNHNQLKIQVINQKYHSPIKRVKKLDLTTLQKKGLSEFDTDSQVREREEKQKQSEQDQAEIPKIGQLQLSSYQKAKQKKQQKEFEEKQKQKMVDLKLNYMVSDLEEKLGFVTKKQKMDHIMYRLASTIEKRVKQQYQEMSSKIKKQEFDLQILQEQAKNGDQNQEGEGEVVSRQIGQFQMINQDSFAFNQRLISPLKLNFQNQEGDQSMLDQNMKLSQSKYAKASISALHNQKKSEVFRHSPTPSSRFLNSQQKSSLLQSNRFKSLSPKQSQVQSVNNYNQIIKEKILDKTPRRILLNEQDQNMGIIDESLVKDFLESLYADQEWTQIASDEQFERIMSLMSEYYGMKEKSQNKYQKLPRYLLAQQELIKGNKSDDHHIASDNDIRSKKGSLKKLSLIKKGINLIGVENLSNDETQNELHILSDEDEDLEEINKQKEEKLFEKYIKQMNMDSTIMKERFVMERYTSYLNKCMFMNSDEFIKKRFKAFMDKKNPKKSENFFSRMQKDQERRIENEKILKEKNQLLSNQNNMNNHLGFKFNQTIESTTNHDIGSAVNRFRKNHLDVPGTGQHHNNNNGNNSSMTFAHSANQYQSSLQNETRSGQRRENNLKKSSNMSINEIYEHPHHSQIQEGHEVLKIKLHKDPEQFIQHNPKLNITKSHNNTNNIQGSLFNYSSMPRSQNKNRPENLLHPGQESQFNLNKNVTNHDELNKSQPANLKFSQFNPNHHNLGQNQQKQLKQVSRGKSLSQYLSKDDDMNDSSSFTGNTLKHENDHDLSSNSNLDKSSSPSFKRSHMRMLRDVKITEKISPNDIIDEKIKQLQIKVIAKKSYQQSPARIKAL